MQAVNDTIAAIASAMGNGAIGVLRLSGPESAAIIERVFLPQAPGEWRMGRLRRGVFVDPAGGAALDEVLVVRFQAPRSFSGQDMAEIQAHGGWRNLRELLAVLLANGARPAEPGEFTLRAFLNGRMDLTEATAVGAVIEAQSELALHAARRHLFGELGRFVQTARERLIAVLARLEAQIDFPEEELPPQDERELRGELTALAETLAAACRTHEHARLAAQGLRVMVVGAPNVGKSSLVNRLLRREAAIVSAEPGTTRDLIEAATTLAGLPVQLVDTAGLREAPQAIEAMGIERVFARLDEVDLVLFVLDGSRPLTPYEHALPTRLAGPRRLVLVNKSDLPRTLSENDLRRLAGEAPVVFVSAKSGQGLAEIGERVAQLFGAAAYAENALQIADARQAAALGTAAKGIERVILGLGERPTAPIELLCAELQGSLRLLDELLGLRTNDEILNAIFSRFCIGK